MSVCLYDDLSIYLLSIFCMSVIRSFICLTSFCLSYSLCDTCLYACLSVIYLSVFCLSPPIFLSCLSSVCLCVYLSPLSLSVCLFPFVNVTTSASMVHLSWVRCCNLLPSVFKLYLLYVVNAQILLSSRCIRSDLDHIELHLWVPLSWSMIAIYSPPPTPPCPASCWLS